MPEKSLLFHKKGMSLFFEGNNTQSRIDSRVLEHELVNTFGKTPKRLNIDFYKEGVSLSETNCLFFTIPKSVETPINLVYNTLRMCSVLKNFNMRLLKTSKGIEVNIHEEDLKHIYLKMNGIAISCLSTERIRYEPVSIRSLEYYDVFDVSPVRLFQTIRLYYSELVAFLDTYNSYLIIGHNKVTLAAGKLAHQKIIQHKFYEHYYKIYTLSIRTGGGGSECGVSCTNPLVVCRMENKTTSFTGRVDDLKEVVLENVSDLEVCFSVNSETSGFLSGKKFGKINKIIRMTNCQIQIQCDEANSQFKFTICHQNIRGMVETLRLINLEYPTYLLFSVDFKHHKKIIGTSGKHIQRIMKKYDVYVKFMNEKEAAYYPENVICKTPYKNRNNLDLIKNEILSSLDIEEPPAPKSLRTRIEFEIPKIYEMILCKAKLMF